MSPVQSISEPQMHVQDGNRTRGTMRETRMIHVTRDLPDEVFSWVTGSLTFP